MTEEAGHPPRIIQIVTAEAGFAYGVINGSIHCFGDGVPVYVLENWHHAEGADQDWLLELPSRMLNARFAVVDFTGRASEMDSLRNWRDNERRPQLAARWLHGPGGQGKTRIAAQFAEESAHEGWKVILATHGPGTILPPPGSQDLSIGDAVGVIVIVDYADRFPLSHLTALLSNSLLHQTGVKTRVLMLARTDGVWPTIRAVLANLQARTSLQRLKPLADSIEDAPSAHGLTQRELMFNTARDTFARHYDVSNPEVITSPSRLDHPDMGLTLAVHMAALVAVDAHSSGRRPTPGMAGLTIYLLDREHLHWARMHGDGTHRLDTGEGAYRTTPDLMNQVVFAAALVGAVPHAVGIEALDALQLGLASEQVIADHGICYPPKNSSRVTALEPLYPDRLAEDFLALTTEGHTVEYPAQAWAPVTVRKLLDRSTDHPLPVAAITRAVNFLAAAAERWPHLGAQCLFPVLWDDPELAMDAGAAALMTISNLEHIDLALLEAIEGHLTGFRHADLDTGIVTLASRLTHHRLQQATDPAKQAWLNSNLGIALINAGFRNDAYAATKQAAKLYRELAEADPAAFEPDLADSLSTLGMRLLELGRWREALAASEEAVSIRRRLAEADPATFGPDLASSLKNLGMTLWQLGRRHDALTVTKAVVEFNRRLVHTDPDAFEPELAGSLANLGVYLSGLGQRQEALVATEEATQLDRRLAMANPAIFEPNLAESLSNLGIRLKEVGRRHESLEATQEAVNIRRRLAEVNPSAFEPDLARSLNNLGLQMWGVGKRQEALTITEEATAIYRQLVRVNPAAFEPELANSLSNVGVYLSGLERQQEALAVTEEAVAIWRRLAEAEPAAFEVALSSSLSNLGTRLSQADRLEEALAVTREAVTVRRRLAEAEPAAFEPDLAHSLNNLGSRLSRVDRRHEALVVLNEAATIFRRLAEAEPAAFEPDLARSLNNLSLQSARLGQQEALTVSREAISLNRRLAKADREVFELDYARSLWTGALVCVDLNMNLQEALELAAESAILYQSWADRGHEGISPDLHAVLEVAAEILHRLGRADDSAVIVQLAARENLTAAVDSLQAIPSPRRPDLPIELAHFLRSKSPLEN